MDKRERELYRAIIDKVGISARIKKFREEAIELLLALDRWEDPEREIPESEVCNELADVLVTASCLSVYFNAHTIARYKGIGLSKIEAIVNDDKPLFKQLNIFEEVGGEGRDQSNN